MKKTLLLIMPVALVSMFAFTDTAKAVEKMGTTSATLPASGDYNVVASDFDYDDLCPGGYSMKSACQQACSGWAGSPCWCKQSGSCWVVTHECPNTCGTNEYCMFSSCMSSLPSGYTCTQAASGCYKRTSDGTYVVAEFGANADQYYMAAIDDGDKPFSGGGSSTDTTKKVNGSCPQGTSLSADKCCCVTNN